MNPYFVDQSEYLIEWFRINKWFIMLVINTKFFINDWLKNDFRDNLNRLVEYNSGHQY